MRCCQTSGAGCIASTTIEITGAATSVAVATTIAASIRPARVARFTRGRVFVRAPPSRCGRVAGG
jgi:hypothetical protein